MKILYITNGQFYEDLHNFNYYQRVFFLSKLCELSIIGTNQISSNNDVFDNVQVIKSHFKGKKGFFIYIILNYKLLKDFDIIITENSAFTIFGLLSKKLFKNKWIIDIWDIPFRDLERNVLSRAKRKLQVLLFRPIFKQSDLNIISIIPNLQLREFDLSENKNRYYKNAIFQDHFENINRIEKFETFSILIQRSVFFKGFGVEFMLDVLKIINRQINADLYIIGRIIPEVEKIINHAGMSDKIIKTGFINHKEFIGIASRVHIAAIPYENEIDLRQIYPIKVIEYMALGKAIVATKLEGLSELIGDAGRLVWPVTPENFADAIITLYKNRNELRRLERMAKRRAQLFDARIKNEQIFREIKNLVNQQI